MLDSKRESGCDRESAKEFDMNPDSNKFEELQAILDGKEQQTSIRPNGTEVPSHWPIFATNETVVLKGYRFKISHIGDQHMLLEPLGTDPEEA